MAWPCTQSAAAATATCRQPQASTNVPTAAAPAAYRTHLLNLLQRGGAPGQLQAQVRQQPVQAAQRQLRQQRQHAGQGHDRDGGVTRLRLPVCLLLRLLPLRLPLPLLQWRRGGGAARRARSSGHQSGSRGLGQNKVGDAVMQRCEQHAAAVQAAQPAQDALRHLPLVLAQPGGRGAAAATAAAGARTRADCRRRLRCICWDAGACHGRGCQAPQDPVAQLIIEAIQRREPQAGMLRLLSLLLLLLLLLKLFLVLLLLLLKLLLLGRPGCNRCLSTACCGRLLRQLVGCCRRLLQLRRLDSCHLLRHHVSLKLAMCRDEPAREGIGRRRLLQHHATVRLQPGRRCR